MKYLFGITFLLVLISCKPQPTKFTGPFLGQELPGDSPVLFAPGIVNTGIATRDITFTPDEKEIYFCKNIGNSTFSTILFCKENKDGWSSPEVISFAQNPKYIFIEPFVSPDGEKMFFVSNQGNKFTDVNRFVTDIWVVERENEFWGEPYKLDSTINSSDSEFFPSVAESGNLYFTRENAKTREGFIYKSKFEDGKYLKPEKLPIQVNAGLARYNAVIAKDESYIIVPTYGMPDSYGATDYYISFFDEKKGWSNPLNMGKKINTNSGNEYSANFSPDGKYLFFMSSKINTKEINLLDNKKIIEIHNSPENGNSNIYWMKADFIHELKEIATFTKKEDL